MNKRLQDIEWVDNKTDAPEDLQKKYRELGYARTIGPELKIKWYWVLRAVQGAPTLSAILKGNLKHVVEEKSLVYEVSKYSYYIDFQTRTLETWFEEKIISKVSFQKLKELGTSYMVNLSEKIK
ncbi:hypothetical protein NHQ30_004538 [Ciborinia camelliae]|nr:hypothetical protein NHQ30_004538 [Ciborinia camelliae]